MTKLRSTLLLACWLGAGAALSAADVPLHGRQVEMAVRGNVRYGPSAEAPVIITLNPGQQVEILREAPGRPGWYVIRFPRQGHAWVHGRNLERTADPRLLRVTGSGAMARSDSRITAEMVDELDAGEVVEWIGAEVEGRFLGRKVGEWHAVYPPNAVAYVYQSVLRLDAPAVRQLQDEAAQEDVLERRWQRARTTYDQYRQALIDDPGQALRLDWAGLATELDHIVAGHGSLRTRLMAKRLHSGVLRVLHVVGEQGDHRRLAGLPVVDESVSRPVEPRPAPTEPRPAPTEPRPLAEAPREQRPVEPARPEDDRPRVVIVPRPTPRPAEQQPSEPTAQPDTEPAVQAEPAPALQELPQVEAPESHAGERSGWLVQRDVPAVGATHALLDANSEVAVLLAPLAGESLQLSQWFWRHVGVRGTAEQVEVELDGRRRQVTLVRVEHVHLLR